VLSGNLKNEEAMTLIGPQRHKNNSSNYLQTFDKLWFPSSGILEDGTDRFLKMGPIV
jgi:hypothetical protein